MSPDSDANTIASGSANQVPNSQHGPSPENNAVSTGASTVPPLAHSSAKFRLTLGPDPGGVDLSSFYNDASSLFSQAPTEFGLDNGTSQRSDDDAGSINSNTNTVVAELLQENDIPPGAFHPAAELPQVSQIHLLWHDTQTSKDNHKIPIEVGDTTTVVNVRVQFGLTIQDVAITPDAAMVKLKKLVKEEKKTMREELTAYRCLIHLCSTPYENAVLLQSSQGKNLKEGVAIWDVDFHARLPANGPEQLGDTMQDVLHTLHLFRAVVLKGEHGECRLSIEHPQGRERHFKFVKVGEVV